MAWPPRTLRYYGSFPYPTVRGRPLCSTQSEIGFGFAIRSDIVAERIRGMSMELQVRQDRESYDPQYRVYSQQIGHPALAVYRQHRRAHCDPEMFSSHCMFRVTELSPTFAQDAHKALDE
jgi:hypothetical protein